MGKVHLIVYPMQEKTFKFMGRTQKNMSLRSIA